MASSSGQSQAPSSPSSSRLDPSNDPPLSPSSTDARGGRSFTIPSRRGRARREPGEEEKKCFKEVFSLFDADADGFISLAELRDALTELGQSRTEDEVDAMFAKYDKNRNGRIEESEFMDLVMGLYYLEETDKRVYFECFRRVDKDQDGTISLEELDRLFAALGRRLREKDLELIFTSMGKEKTDSVGYDELIDFIFSTCGEQGGEESVTSL